MLLVILFGVWVLYPNSSALFGADKCQGLERGPKLACWQAGVESLLATKGVAEAFQMVKRLSSADPLFAAECHDFVHLLGTTAAARFIASDGTAWIPPETAFCAYGFYHGFMEAVLLANGSVSDARRFCESVGETFKEQAPGAGQACLHGIGHGITDPHDNRPRKNAEELAAPALAVCDAMSGTPLETYLCASGVFNALEIMMTTGAYGLAVGEDPFRVCREQPERFASACYTNMVPAVLARTGNALAKSGATIATIANGRFAGNAMEAAAAEMLRMHYGGAAPSPQDAVPVCQSLDPRLRLPCIQGLAGGFLKYGPAESAYQEALRFCQDRALKNDERELCLTKLLGNDIRVYFSLAKADELCAALDESLQPYCKRNVAPPF